MTEEIQTQKEQQSNTVALIGMICSIVGLILLLTIFGSFFGLFLLVLGFILGIIGLFYKPRAKARVAVIIPLFVFIAITSIACYVWKSVKTPAVEFVDWLNLEFENIDEETFDKDRFNEISNEEFNKIVSSMSEENIRALIENTTGSNVIEKGSYALFGLLRQGFENSLERYNNELPGIESEDTNMNEEIIEEIETFEESEENESEENDEIIEETENIEVSDESGEDNIEQILDSLE